MLDTNVLVRLCHPTGYRDVQEWFRSLLLRGADAPEILVSVLADYELRATLTRRGANASLAQLDNLAQSVTYIPVTKETARLAAEISARSGGEGRSRVSGADALIAAQAEAEGAILVTSDRGLLEVPGLKAKDWSEIELGA
ncbi:type II toxin-antitoxin system VapC family toxin [Sorangium sp. So ce426]|uniref:type II toxin-antitoxin system VapC family toxin n=1 Tax=unclassified Sorangium TaxID=2621164 RepID=UPI003F5BB89A